MALNPNYMIAPSIEEYFVDKDTGLPLAGGKVYFYSDTNRNVLKPIYTLSGSPPNYSYVQLSNPVTLSAVGTFQDDDGNNVLPYYFPFTDEGASTVDLYYIQVYSADDVLQFSREGYPNFAGNTAVTSLSELNYVPNGQFLLHNDDPPAKTEAISGFDVLQIAPGGWTYESTHSATDTDLITFPRFANYVGNPSGSPRYRCQVQCTVSGNAASKALGIKFYDVNKFSNSSGITQNFTFSFTAINNNLGVIPIELSLVKYFGAGGSSTETTSLISFNITSQYTIYSTSFSFGDNVGQTIGTGDDDYVQLSLSFPLGTTFNLAFTDFILTPGTVGIAGFPNQTNAQMIDESTSGFLPNPAFDGSDFYLPLVNTPTGYLVDKSFLGQIELGTYTDTYALANNYPVLLCDGSQYFANHETSTNNYSSLGIPYTRLLGQFIGDSPITNVPKYGTGLNYATAYAIAGNTSAFRVTVNSTGTITGAAAGTSGFTVTNIHTGTSTINFAAYSSSNGVLAVLDSGAFLSSPTAGNSGFTVVEESTMNGLTAFQHSSFVIETIAASLMTAGHYFTFSNASTNYYMWFKINGSGADPAPGGTGIEVDILSTYTASDVANAVREALNEYQSSLITVGSPPAAGTYWTFNANPGTPQAYYVWYQVDGVGTKPIVSGLAIKVNILSTDNAAQVVSKTQLAVNSYYLALPDFRGMFPRGFDPDGTWDIDVLSRWSNVSGIGGALLNTFEYAQFLEHYHRTEDNDTGVKFITSNAGGSGMAGGDLGEKDVTGLTGGSEIRPVNFAINWYIRY